MNEEIYRDKPFNAALQFVMVVGDWTTYLNTLRGRIKTNKKGRDRNYEEYRHGEISLEGLLIELTLSSRFDSHNDKIQDLMQRVSNTSPTYTTKSFDELITVHKEINKILARTNIIEVKPATMKAEEMFI